MNPRILSMLAIISPILLLASCAAQEAQERADERAAVQAQAAQDDASCRAYGATPGTSVYVQCRMNLDNQRVAHDEENRALGAAILANRPLF